MTRAAATTLLLDLDGTLSDNYPGIAASVVHALQRLGEPPPDAAALRACVGPPLRTSFAHLVSEPTPERIESAIAFYRERFRDVGWRENVPYDGVPAMLETLAKRHRLFVCTSKPEVFATRIVEHFGFDRHVERVYGADLAGALDDKRMLLSHLLATERLDAGACAMIGDRGHDLRAARANATACIGVLWGYGSREELEGADAFADSPATLPSVVEALVGRNGPR